MLRCNRFTITAFAASSTVAAALPLRSAPATAGLRRVFLSGQLAAQAFVATGDTVSLAPSADGSGARTFRVAGIYEPTPDPVRFSTRRLEARLHLPDLNALTAAADDPDAADSLDAINVRLTAAGDAVA